MTLWATVTGFKMVKLTAISPHTRFCIVFLVTALWAQLFLGMNVIWNNVPIQLASAHQIGAMTILTSVLMLLHSAKRVDPRQIKNLIGKMRAESPESYKNYMNAVAKANPHRAKQFEEMLEMEIQKMKKK